MIAQQRYLAQRSPTPVQHMGISSLHRGYWGPYPLNQPPLSASALLGYYSVLGQLQVSHISLAHREPR